MLSSNQYQIENILNFLSNWGWLVPFIKILYIVIRDIEQAAAPDDQPNVRPVVPTKVHFFAIYSKNIHWPVDQLDVLSIAWWFNENLEFSVKKLNMKSSFYSNFYTNFIKKIINIENALYMIKNTCRSQPAQC